MGSEPLHTADGKCPFHLVYLQDLFARLIPDAIEFEAGVALRMTVVAMSTVSFPTSINFHTLNSI